MKPRIQREQIGGTSVRIADCYIWAQIYYMDSPTDYRECIPSGRAGGAIGAGLVMLDERRAFPIGTGRLLERVLPACVLLVMIVLTLKCWL